MRERINFTDWLVHKKEIYSKIYSEFTFSRLGGIGFLVNYGLYF